MYIYIHILCTVYIYIYTLYIHIYILYVYIYCIYIYIVYIHINIKVYTYASNLCSQLACSFNAPFNMAWPDIFGLCLIQDILVVEGIRAP